MQQLSLYWQTSNPDQLPGNTPSMDPDAWQQVEHPVLSQAEPASGEAAEQHLDGEVRSGSWASLHTADTSTILPPTDCDLRISIKTDKHTGVTRLGAVALVEEVQLCFHKEQMSDVARMQDEYAVWNLHNQYAVLRPTGWRSDSSTTVPSR